ncbi:emp24/gp25L/p24 family/GOLD-domain-containing protein [Panaeolus papilionaceus]|nr:emp24/gp25L/p24 family/GOLD-domain-containing protein [Panaeolus papilionaceus]
MSRLYTRSLIISWLSFLIILPTLINAHLIEVAAGKKECFFEDLHINDKWPTYLTDPGHAINTCPKLSDPAGKVLGKQVRQSTGQLAITAENDGRHEYCFSNQMSAIADKMVSFNVHGVIYVSGDGDVVAPIEREIRKFASGLVAVKDEQEYIVVREKTHRNTAESTNSRVKWWSILQAIVLFSVVGWQIYYLKSFFEVKRVI